MDGPRDVRSLIAAGLWALTGVTALVLGGRAAVGAFDSPVDGTIPVITTAIAVTASMTAWWLFYASDHSTRLSRRLLVGFLSLMAPAVIAFATTVQASPFALGATVGLLVLGLTAVIVSEGLRLDVARSDVRKGVAHGSGAVDSLPHDHHAHPVGLGVPPDFEQIDPPPLAASDHEQADAVQQITRRQEADGSESIEAVLLATFLAGARETVVHLPVHPVLPTKPVVECEPLDDCDVVTSVTTAQPYGVRIELKRSEDTDRPLTVAIGVAISSDNEVANVA